MIYHPRLGEIHAVLLDVDGTLYRQGELKIRLLVQFFLSFLHHPFSSFRDAKILYHFRKDREVLRKISESGVDLEKKQYEVTARRLGISHDLVRTTVKKWIFDLPLPYIKKSKYKGVDEFIRKCKHAGLKVGVYSDYPSRSKVEAMGLTKWIDLYLCSTDPKINAFKPSTRGLELAVKSWGEKAGNVLYIGDRLDVDAESAAKLGMPFVLIGKAGKFSNHTQVLWVRNYHELLELLNL